MGAVLIVDDTPTNLEILVDYLSDRGFEAYVATDGESALEQLEHTHPDLILLDVMMPGMDGFETCARLKEKEATRDIPVIFMTALSETTDKIRGFDAGGVDYVVKPIQHEEVLARVTTQIRLRRLQQELQEANAGLEEKVSARTAELQVALTKVEELKAKLEAENEYLKEEIRREHGLSSIIGADESLERTLEEVQQVAPTSSTVLILGETGVGKELIARAVHDASPRRDQPMVKVNCAALPENLIESELFGHEKGAFTGALTRKIGRFELADGGTIFLDEVGDLPLALQAKLLRVLQEGELERLGNPKTITVDVRVIAATNRDLEKAIEDGQYREDLYYRLNVFPIRVPPLRERKSDIPLLVDHFVEKCRRKVGKSIRTVPNAVIDRLQGYAFPGNVRELENIVERAVITSPEEALDLGSWVPSRRASQVAPPADAATTLKDVERRHIERVLEKTGWLVSGPKGAAAILDINPKTLESRMKKLGIERPAK